MAPFIWPSFLWGLLLLPLLVALYVRQLRRAVRYPIAYSTTPLLAAVLVRSRRRRHLAPALFLLGIAAIVLALMRPVVALPVPADRSAIMLSLDISGSMRSQDIAPSRLEAAKAAATTFVDAMPDRVRIGLVVFAGFASLLSPPTTDHQHIRDLISGLGTARRTAIGEGLLEAVAGLPGRARPTAEGVLPPLAESVPPGIVVLLSDGRNNAGIDPLLAAELGRQQQVKVYTVGMGDRVTREFGWTIGGPLDEETLQAMAAITGGAYHHASSAAALHSIYRSLAREIGWERRPTEVSAVAAGAALVFLIAAAVLSFVIAQPLRA